AYGRRCRVSLPVNLFQPRLGRQSGGSAARKRIGRTLDFLFGMLLKPEKWISRLILLTRAGSQTISHRRPDNEIDRGTNPEIDGSKVKLLVLELWARGYDLGLCPEVEEADPACDGQKKCGHARKRFHSGFQNTANQESPASSCQMIDHQQDHRHKTIYTSAIPR